MSSRGLLALLLPLTVALAGAVIYQAHLLRNRSADTAPPASVSNPAVNQQANDAIRLSPPAPAGPLDWTQLASTNYFTYIANLRAVRCPEETIRAIILSEVGRAFAARRAALRPPPPPFRFWQTNDARDRDATLSPEVRRRLRELDQEEKALLRELLGEDYERQQATLLGQEDDTECRVGFLPAAKQTRVLELLARYEAAEEDVLAQTRGFLTDEDHARLKLLQRERAAELARLLTPEELEEFNLRNSDTAHRLRYNLAGFDPTEEEFRKIFRLQKQFDDRFGAAFTPEDDAKQQAYRAACQKLEQDLRRALGEARYHDYQRAQDADYQTLIQIADRFQLGHDAANQVFELKQALEQHRQRLLTEPGLSPEQKRQAYHRLLQDAEASAAQRLGEAAFKLYKKNSAAWLDDFDFLEESGPPSPAPAPAH